MAWYQQIGVTLTPYAWATHILIAAVMQAIIAAGLAFIRVPRPWWFGAAVAIGYAWSRKKTEFEFILKDAARSHTLGPFWYRGFFPFEWPWVRQWEFYAPAIAVLVIAYVLERDWCSRRKANRQKS